MIARQRLDSRIKGLLSVKELRVYPVEFPEGTYSTGIKIYPPLADSLLPPIMTG